MRVAFRVDASVRIGTGHAMRCLALADELLRRGAETCFVGRDVAGGIAARITAQGHALVRLPPASAPGGPEGPPHAAWLDATQEEDAAATARALADGGRWDWLVVDHYALDARWERALGGAVGRLLVVDDLADRSHEADAIVDGNLQGSAGDRYAGLAPRGCRRLTGPAFALLRPEFRGPVPERPAGERRRLNVFYGGVDAAGMTLRALEALALLPRNSFEADVVVGSANPRLDEVTRCCAGLPVRLHVDATDMARLFRAADLGLGAGGVAALERCATGLAAVIVPVAENQRPGSRALARARAALVPGDAADVGAATLARVTAALCARPGLLARMGRRAASLVDGRGVERVAVYMAARDGLTLRRAEADDVRKAWLWRNHPETRRWSLDDAEVPWDTHRAWWERALASPSRDLLMAQAGGSDVGVLRYDVAGEVATASIYLDPGLRGLGLGGPMLRLGTEWLRGARPELEAIRAEILPSNVASQRIFASAGYVQSSNPQEWHLPLRAARSPAAPGGEGART